jgi:hypothetical protein
MKSQRQIMCGSNSIDQTLCWQTRPASGHGDWSPPIFGSQINLLEPGGGQIMPTLY